MLNVAAPRCNSATLAAAARFCRLFRLEGLRIIKTLPSPPPNNPLLFALMRVLSFLARLVRRLRWFLHGSDGFCRVESSQYAVAACVRVAVSYVKPMFITA